MSFPPDSDEPQPANPTPGRLSRIGHRGCVSPGPENTVAAVEAAAPYVDAVEIDARLCGTGEPVVFHDETLDRVTDGTGRVDETPLATLRTLDVLDTGEPIPTLSELLAAISALPSELAVDVEIKAAGAAERVLATCAESDVDVFYSSFHGSVLRELRAADPDAPLAVVYSEDPLDALELADAVDAVAVHPWTELVLDGSDETGSSVAAPVREAHDRGFIVNAWSADTASDVRKLDEAGVDGVIADRWDVFESRDGDGTRRE